MQKYVKASQFLKHAMYNYDTNKIQPTTRKLLSKPAILKSPSKLWTKCSMSSAVIDITSLSQQHRATIFTNLNVNIINDEYQEKKMASMYKATSSYANYIQEYKTNIDEMSSSGMKKT